MNNLRLFFAIFLLFLTSTFSCQEESKSTDDLAMSETQDTLIDTPTNTRSIEGEPEIAGMTLIGKWILKERKMGAQVLEMLENDESTLEFTTEGMLVSESDGFEPESFEFTRTDDLLTSDLWDTAQSIKALSEDELVLVYQVDGVDIDHVYQRVR